MNEQLYVGCVCWGCRVLSRQPSLVCERLLLRSKILFLFTLLSVKKHVDFKHR